MIVKFPFDIKAFFQKYTKQRILPKNDFEKQAILLELLNSFEDNNKYAESEVNGKIKIYFDDFPLVRRELINFGYMQRDSEKGIYWVVKRTLTTEDIEKNTILKRHAAAFKIKKLILSGCLVVNDKRELLLLYRKDHNHYETPGGKVKAEECSDPNNPSINDLARTAERELYEELGEDIKVEKLSFFGKVEFTIPDGRLAVANKFVTRIISGTPVLNEPNIFERFDYLPITQLEKYNISPDLRLLLPQLKSRL